MWASISFNQSHKSSISHNNRNHISGNPDIDKGRIQENIYYVQKSIQEVYADVFDNAIEEYNKKQNRKDRKIENYYEKVHKDSKTHEQRELVIAVGKKDDEIDQGTKKEILDQYAKKFQEENPNLAVYNMVLHLDEANPHLHINYVPNFESTRGLQRRVGMDRALQQQGIEGKGTELIKNWREKETAKIEELCRQKILGFQRENVGSHKYMKVPQYKKFAEDLSIIQKNKEKVAMRSVEIASETNKLRDEVKVLSDKHNYLEGECDRLKGNLEDVRGEYEDKKEKIEEINKKFQLLSQNKVDRISIVEKKTILGKNTGIIEVKKEDWDNVLSKAKLTEVSRHENSYIASNNGSLKRENERLVKHLAQERSDNATLLKEKAALTKENNMLKKTIEKVKELYKEKIPNLAFSIGYIKANMLSVAKERILTKYFSEDEVSGAQEFMGDIEQEKIRKRTQEQSRVRSNRDYGLER